MGLDFILNFKAILPEIRDFLFYEVIQQFSKSKVTSLFFLHQALIILESYFEELILASQNKVPELLGLDEEG